MAKVPPEELLARIQAYVRDIPEGLIRDEALRLRLRQASHDLARSLESPTEAVGRVFVAQVGCKDQCGSRL